MVKFLIINSRVYPEISLGLLHGATNFLQKLDINFKEIVTPGALETPIALSMAIDTNIYDAYIILGCIVRGNTDHYKHVSENTNTALTKLATKHMIPIGNGILSVHNIEHAIARSCNDDLNYGHIAANAALEMLHIKQQFAKVKK
ncbi:6,7-dimethyl-8-ribityllumazine synthase [Candidatus Xenohaliotis californiensis]|uniref:6,7-dimethyl-8-ribityllumazine synthase n=1 Tax=Candidatus Xenohaliotis californiensis TaxID=84677 RepID=A0ABM9N6Y3_9RICK|nr:6,7-dimethyl-8-ribityllumazine synthase [Candidatus Xenohaliotis californiensis]